MALNTSYGIARISIIGRSEDQTEGVVYYEVLVEPRTGVPWRIRKRFSEFEQLHSALALVFHQIPDLPNKIPFASFFPSVLNRRSEALEIFLDRCVFKIDPGLTSASLRNFLEVPPYAVPGREKIVSDSGACEFGSRMLPADNLRIILSFLDLQTIYRSLGIVSKSIRKFIVNSHPVSSLRFTCQSFEICQPGLYRLLEVSQSSLRRLCLGIRFTDHRGFIHFPEHVKFLSLQSLTLQSVESASNELFSQILLSVESQLENLEISARLENSIFASIASMDLSSIKSMKFRWTGESVEIADSHGIQAVLSRVEDTLESLQLIKTSPLTPFTGKLDIFDCIARMWLLKEIKFDFLNDLLFSTLPHAPRLSQCTALRSAEFSGLREPTTRVEHILTLLLPKLPSSLVSLKLFLFEDSDNDWLFRGYVPQPVGSLNESWSNLSQIQELVIHGSALDNEGLTSIGNNLPRLKSLCLQNHLEFVTDSGVLGLIEKCRNLHELEVCGECEWLSDSLLLKISELTDSRLETVKLQRTRHMSWIGLDAIGGGRANVELTDESVQERVKRADEKARVEFNSIFISFMLDY